MAAWVGWSLFSRAGFHLRILEEPWESARRKGLLRPLLCQAWIYLVTSGAEAFGSSSGARSIRLIVTVWWTDLWGPPASATVFVPARRGKFASGNETCFSKE